MPIIFLVLFALLTPRLVVAAIWLFTQWFNGLFSSPLWLILGFLLLPTSLLWYSVVQHWFGGVWSTGPVVGMIVALVIDLSPAGGHSRFRRRTD